MCERLRWSLQKRPAAASHSSQCAYRSSGRGGETPLRSRIPRYMSERRAWAAVHGLITMVSTKVEGQSNYRTIEELQSNLDPDTFWRVHRSYLVNINRTKEVIPWFKSSYQLRMDDRNQTEIPVSRVQTKRLRSLLKL